MHASSKTGSPPSSSQPPVDSLQHLSPRFSATALQPESSLNQLDVKDLSNMVHLESDDINIIVAKGSFGEVRRGILQRGEGRTTTLQVALKALVLRTPLQSDGQVRLTKVSVSVSMHTIPPLIEIPLSAIPTRDLNMEQAAASKHLAFSRHG